MYVCCGWLIIHWCLYKADDGDGVSVYLLCLRHFRSIHPEVTSLSLETIGPCLHHINDQVYSYIAS